ncbi:hypothetical protein [Thiomonas sp. FB-Cd]|uniref:hypothetical protein n=1 Tax=Thiomonas sp. FB-Cd TaxID=1158292 RepID=UPI000A599B44|nr:hypothetical protein [Thiomonas sp. FB-Cd]
MKLTIRRRTRSTVVMAALLVAAWGPSAQAQMPGGGDGAYGGYGGMMGGGMMGGGMMGFAQSDRPVEPGWGGAVLDYAQVRDFLAGSTQGARVDARTHTVTFSGRDVRIAMVAVQPGHPDQTFEVAGLTNPTLVVPRGATVRIDLVNMDYGRNMEHGLIITAVPPPYPYMAMMATGPGLVQLEPLLPWRSDSRLRAASYAALSTSFVAGEPGTYWYVCPTPEHAEKGMVGRFIIR